MSQAATTMSGQLHGNDVAFRGVSIDTRTLDEGELFVALQGPNFDGADFIPNAVSRGAAGAVVEAKAAAELPSIVVDDSHHALATLAADWRARMSATVIGVTGSNGKTTLKELIHACLAPVARTLATAGNLNNDIGLPLMLLRLAPEHRFAVLEMGANHAGEIAYLTSLAQPEIVVISNAGPAHLEGFGSIDGVASAKGEILQGEPAPRIAVLNADDPYYEQWCGMAVGSEILSFGYAEDASISVRNVQTTSAGSTFDLKLPMDTVHINLGLPGKHNALNAAAAAAVAVAAGLDTRKIKRGLESLQPVAGRLQPVHGINAIHLYDDSYNANPSSVVAAAQFIAAQKGTAWLVMGDMAELGDEAAVMHAAVGEQIRESGVDKLFATGELAKRAVASFGDAAEWFATVDELVDRLRESLQPGINVLVKGSRSMRMERVVDALRADQGTGER